jgi:hypothetical protein
MFQVWNERKMNDVKFMPNHYSTSGQVQCLTVLYRWGRGHGPGCAHAAPPPNLHVCVDGVPEEDMRVADETHAMITLKAVLSILFGYNQQITITSVTLVKLPACFNPHRVIFWVTSLA